MGALNMVKYENLSNELTASTKCFVVGTQVLALLSSFHLQEEIDVKRIEESVDNMEYLATKFNECVPARQKIKIAEFIAESKKIVRKAKKNGMDTVKNFDYTADSYAKEISGIPFG